MTRDGWKNVGGVKTKNVGDHLLEVRATTGPNRERFWNCYLDNKKIATLGTSKESKRFLITEVDKLRKETLEFPTSQVTDTGTATFIIKGQISQATGKGLGAGITEITNRLNELFEYVEEKSDDARMQVIYEGKWTYNAP